MLNRCRVIILLRIRILIFACQLQSDADPDPAYKFVADPDACILQNDGQVKKKHGSPQYKANMFDLPPSQSLLHFICPKTRLVRFYQCSGSGFTGSTVFGPPGSGSGPINQRYRSGSTPKCHGSGTLVFTTE